MMPESVRARSRLSSGQSRERKRKGKKASKRKKERERERERERVLSVLDHPRVRKRNVHPVATQQQRGKLFASWSLRGFFEDSQLVYIMRRGASQRLLQATDRLILRIFVQGWEEDRMLSLWREQWRDFCDWRPPSAETLHAAPWW